MTAWTNLTSDPMTIRWLSNDFNVYPMTIQCLSRTCYLFFLMIVDLKRSIDRKWWFKSGASFILRWSCFMKLSHFIFCIIFTKTFITYMCTQFHIILLFWCHHIIVRRLLLFVTSQIFLDKAAPFWRLKSISKMHFRFLLATALPLV